MTTHNYIRVRRCFEQTLDALTQLFPTRPLRGPEDVTFSAALNLGCPDGAWLGLTFFLCEVDDWTVVHDVTRAITFEPDELLQLSGGADLVAAGYNDSIPLAHLTQIEGGQITLHCQHGTGSDVLCDDYPGWPAVAAFVDADEALIPRPGQGIVFEFPADYPR